MITNPSNPIPLPEEIAKEVEKVKHQLTLDELSMHNARKSRIAEEQTLSEIIKEKAGELERFEILKEDIAKLTAIKETLLNETISLNELKTRLNQENTALLSSITDFKEEMHSRLGEVEKAEKEIEENRSKAEKELKQSLEEKLKAQDFVKKIHDIVASHS